jgi:hypothetical protein
MRLHIVALILDPIFLNRSSLLASIILLTPTLPTLIKRVCVLIDIASCLIAFLILLGLDTLIVAMGQSINFIVADASRMQSHLFTTFIGDLWAAGLLMLPFANLQSMIVGLGIALWVLRLADQWHASAKSIHVVLQVWPGVHGCVVVALFENAEHLSFLSCLIALASVLAAVVQGRNVVPHRYAAQ